MLEDFHGAQDVVLRALKSTKRVLRMKIAVATVSVDKPRALALLWDEKVLVVEHDVKKHNSFGVQCRIDLQNVPIEMRWEGHPIAFTLHNHEGRGVTLIETRHRLHAPAESPHLGTRTGRVPQRQRHPQLDP